MNKDDIAYAILPVTALSQNCTFIWNRKDNIGAVIDPGGDVERILEVIKEHDLKIQKILITHAHADHAGGTAELKEALAIPIEGPHPDDKFWIDRIESDGMLFGIGECRKFTPDRWLYDGDEVMIGDITLKVIHCPGHTPGHVIFYHALSNTAQVGDVLFKGSIGRTDFPRGNHNDLIESITKKLWPLGDEVQFICGHGETSSFGYERAHNPFVGDRAIKP